MKTSTNFSVRYETPFYMIRSQAKLVSFQGVVVLSKVNIILKEIICNIIHNQIKNETAFEVTTSGRNSIPVCRDNLCKSRGKSKYIASLFFVYRIFIDLAS